MKTDQTVPSAAERTEVPEREPGRDGRTEAPKRREGTDAPERDARKQPPARDEGEAPRGRDARAAARADAENPDHGSGEGAAIENIVRRAVKRHAGEASAVLLAGSAAGCLARSNGLPPAGDLDVVAFVRAGRSRRLTVREAGVLIELFGINERDFPALLREARRTALPSLPRMCRDGRIVHGGRRAEAFARAAERTFRAGPLPVTFAELDRRRWELTELADDFRHAARPEALFVAARLLEKAAEFLLRAGDRWMGVGKWALRALEESDPAAARELTDAAEMFCRHDDRRPLLRFVDRALAPFGGPLREGWAEEARIGGRPEKARTGTGGPEETDGPWPGVGGEETDAPKMAAAGEGPSGRMEAMPGNETLAHRGNAVRCGPRYRGVTGAGGNEA